MRKVKNYSGKNSKHIATTKWQTCELFSSEVVCLCQCSKHWIKRCFIWHDSESIGGSRTLKKKQKKKLQLFQLSCTERKKSIRIG